MKTTAALIGLLLLFGAFSFRGAGIDISAGGMFRDAAQVGLQREQVKQNGETDRARIAEEGRAAALPWAVGAIAIVGATCAFVAWSSRPHRPVPQQVLMLAAPHLAQRPEARIEMVDGTWCVVDPERRELIRVSGNRDIAY